MKFISLAKFWIARRRGFTLPEILVAVSIFAVVSTVTASLYVRSFRESRRAATQNQIYDDARFTLARIADEIRGGTVDYDEYFNQNVVINQVKANPNSITGEGLQNYGQNYGRYFSSFFNPGNDQKLGFDCNDAGRNKKTCTPLRRSLDRITGMNPFIGKYNENSNLTEDAFCGVVTYLLNLGAAPSGPYGICQGGEPDPSKEKTQSELYLISSDGTRKTILAREKIGANSYALSMLKLKGVDTNNDAIPDSFVCADEFQCRGSTYNVLPDHVQFPAMAADSACNNGDAMPFPVDLPRFDPTAAANARATDLTEGDTGCDPKANGFSKEFVPVSPLRVNVKELKFLITPTENPHYGFAEDNSFGVITQPRVTILLTIEPNPEYTTLRESFPPLTLIQTISAGSLSPVPAPLLVE